MLFHLHSVSKNHVQVEHQILDLQFQRCKTAHQLSFIIAAPDLDVEQTVWLLSTCSGKGVSRSSRSSSAYVRIVLSDRRRCSSLKFCDVPTSEDSDMVTCIFTRAKFWIKGRNKTDCDSQHHYSIYSTKILYVLSGYISVFTACP